MVFYDQSGTQNPSPHPAARAGTSPTSTAFPEPHSAGGGFINTERTHPDVLVTEFIERAQAVVRLVSEYYNSQRFPCIVEYGPEGIDEYTPSRDDIGRLLERYIEAREALQHECPELASIARLRATNALPQSQLDALEECVLNARKL